MQSAIIGFIIGSSSTLMIAVFVGRMLVNAKVVECMRDCNYTECEKYCEVERVNRNLNREFVNVEKKLDFVIKDNMQILKERNKFAKDISNKLT